jgi:hypothetical protein
MFVLSLIVLVLVISWLLRHPLWGLGIIDAAVNG